jgi:hypothetical protein
MAGIVARFGPSPLSSFLGREPNRFPEFDDGGVLSANETRSGKIEMTDGSLLDNPWKL